MKRLRQYIFSTAAIFVLVTGVLQAQQQQIGKILSLSVIGNKVSEASVIKLSSGLREGKDVTWEDVNRAVKQLWALGIFSDIQVVIEGRTSDGVFMAIQVEEYPKLERVDITGNKKIKRDELDKSVTFFRGQVISPGQMADARKQILNLYAEKGYTLAAVEMDTEPTEKENRVILKIKINEGKKVQIKRIRFFGNTVFDDGKLRKQMKGTKEDRWWRGADYNKEKYREDLDKVLTFFQNHGYRDAEVVKDSLYYNDQKEDMFIDIWVREGLCYYIGNITWEGNTIFSEQELEAKLEFKEGDPFSQEDFEKSIGENLGGMYYDLGYIYAQINPRETLRDQDSLDVHFVINEGEPVKIRKILISGNTRTKERVIRRELRVKPGDVFSKELLVRSVRDLMMLNYFGNVVPEPTGIPGNNEEMDVKFKVEEKSTDTANISAGYSELDRLIGSIGLGMNNLFGNGQQLTLDWSFGSYYRSFNLGFTEPWFRNTPTLIGLSVFDTKRDAYYIGYSQRSRGFQARFGRRFTWPDNYFRGDWIYGLDQTELGDFSDYIKAYNPNNIVYEDWPLTSSSITQVISRNSLDQPEFPTRGSKVSYSSEFAGGPLGGNVGYWKNVFSAEFYVPTISPKLILLTRAQAGFIHTIDKVPYLDHFFMGGSGMSRAIPLRGYEDPLANGSYYYEGGKTMLQSTVELRFPIIPNPMMYGLMFAEAGNTWLDFDSTDPFDLCRSVGVGIRIYMPMIGMIGFDYAYGFDHEDSSGMRYGEWKTHFVFGR